MLVPNLTPGKDFLDIYEMDVDRMAITRDEGDDRASQQFDISRYELVKQE